ncbi:zincin-like metallopeptidase domain-containing protein [Asticcacaulis sp. SL142]|nr:zincin-like metallopeptidase domain-containing protein [Asticcacaulis sp. SL142]
MSRLSLYEEVTRRIMSELEAGRYPWAQAWGKAGASGPGLPRNAVTSARYSGINVLLLWDAAITHGFAAQSWLTFKQALAAGGSVRKGERGTTIVFADRFTPEAERQKALETGEDARAVPFLKRYTVFNVAQCENLRGVGQVNDVRLPERDLIPHAQKLISATGADVRIGGDQACYVPSADYIQVPPQPAFSDQINYYRTCFHELSHWTGHASRLNRDQSGRFGTTEYGREELCAEMGSAFVCAALGITPTVRHADYLGAWLDILREDNRAIFRAASQASKAADFILAFGPDAPASLTEVAA